MSILELHHVSVSRGRRRQRVQAMQDVCLAIDPAEVVLLEGPSGAGKSTLLCVAAGLLSPDAGDVVIAGQRLGDLGPSALRAFRARTIGFVFQRANLLDGLSVRDNVALAATLAGFDVHEARRRADRLLTGLGIGTLGHRRTTALSGGEEHRVAVARALVHEPRVILADEPTGNLDGASGHAVAEALASLANEQGVAVVIATHDARLRPFADRRLHMVDGHVEAELADATDQKGETWPSLSPIA